MYPQNGQPQYGHQQPQYAPQGYYPPAPPPRKKQTLLIVGLVIGAPLLFLVLMVGAGLLMYATADEKPGTPADRAKVMTVDDLSPWMYEHTPLPSGETLTRREFLDGSFELEYMYDDPELYIYCCVTVEKNPGDAKTIYESIQIGNSIGARMDDHNMREIPQDHVFKWGDESRFTQVTYDGAPGGNHLIARKGNHVIEILFSGVYFDERESLNELLIPVLNRATTATR